MLHLHANYTLFKRGKYYYYYTYNAIGIRQNAKTTHCKLKKEAQLYCDDLLRSGILYSGRNIKFGTYAKNFFEPTSIWIQDRLRQGTPDHPAIASSTITSYQKHHRLYIMPFFANLRILDLCPTIIKQFRFWLMDEKKVSNKTINNCCSCLKIITDEALGDGVIYADPFRGIKPLFSVGNKRDAFSFEEAKKIFEYDAWKSNEAKMLSFVSALTGLRISEILGLRLSDFKENYIDLKQQRYNKEVRPLKTKEARCVPICDELIEIIKNYATENEFIFDPENICIGNVNVKYVVRDLGLDPDKNRNLTFHSWRHFYNTYLLGENVNPLKVASVLGHSTGVGTMQERYTNFKIENYAEVLAAQKKLLKSINYF